MNKIRYIEKINYNEDEENDGTYYDFLEKEWKPLTGTLLSPPFKTDPDVIRLANLFDLSYDEIMELVTLNFNNSENSTDFLLSLENSLIENYSEDISSLLMMNIYNNILEIDQYGDVDAVYTNKSELYNKVIEEFSLIGVFARSIALCLIGDKEKFGIDRQEGIFMLSATCHTGNATAGNYSARLTKHNGKYTYLNCFSFNNALDAIFFTYVSLVQNKIKIKICQNCGKYFIPTKRSDEIYCDNIFKNGRTCKQLGYEIKISKDEIVNTYRKIYKTQNARKQRNKNSINNIDKKFKKWSYFAKAKLIECQNGNIELSEFKKIIADDSWLRK